MAVKAGALSVCVHLLLVLTGVGVLPSTAVIIDQSLVNEQVCYLPERELVREDQLQHANISEDIGGLYISTTTPSQCSGGVVTMIEVCAALRKLTNGTEDDYRMFAYLYRHNEQTLLFDQVGVKIDIRAATASFGCQSLEIEASSGWTIQEGDVLGVYVPSQCDGNFCPAQPIIIPSQTVSNAEILYFNISATPSLVPSNRLIPTSAVVNIRASVVSTPPPLPATCSYPLPTPTCVNTLPQSSPIPYYTIGEVDTQPEPERRFWGGGTYIMPEKSKINGTAVSVEYCALLNTQGTRSLTFRFRVGLIREIPESTTYMLVKHVHVEIDSARPTSVAGFNNTIHCGTDPVPLPNWEVLEGDQFAVYIYNHCTADYCPAHVNLLNKDSCQATLYRPGTEGFGSVRTNNRFLRPVPLDVNIKVSIAPSNPSYTPKVLPLCATSFSTFSMSDTTITPTMSFTTPTIRSPTTTVKPDLNSTTIRFTTETFVAPSTPATQTRSSNLPAVLSTIGAFTLFSIISLLALAVIVIVILVKLRRKSKRFSLEKPIEIRGQDIALSEIVHVEVNEQGRMRRRTIETGSPYETLRTRAFSKLNDYSEVVSRQDSSSESMPPSTSTNTATSQIQIYAQANYNGSLPPSLTNTAVSRTEVYTRANYNNGTLSPNYETDCGDYTAPVFIPANKEDELKHQLKSLGIDEIPEEQLEFEEEIGKGQFGTVYKALWNLTITDNKSDPQAISAHVAVKVMEDQNSTEDRIKFLQEAVLMGQFSDPNIVAVFGVITTSSRLMMLCELMDEDLRKHLTKIKNKIQNCDDNETDNSELPALLLSYCRKIASSFVYLGLKGFVHRDLAARNILVSCEGDCKIADFGMSRDLQDDPYYRSHGGMVPVKWTAPEAIMNKKYSTKSDVWSYGILLYEIWSLGCKPYSDLTNQGVIIKVETGYRLPPPPGCPRTIYDLMIKCTHPQVESRPTFTNILVSLQRPDYQLLKWSPDDVATSSEAARVLGAPLDEGQCLYRDLQNIYLRDGDTECCV